MKCKNCGKNEISFRFSGNINGTVTDVQLCSECASKTIPGFTAMFNTGGLFEKGFTYNPLRAIMSIPMPGFSMLTQTAGDSRFFSMLPVEERIGSREDSAVPENNEFEADQEIRKRREINVIKEQMHQAAEREDYELAAQLRDQIIRLESTEGLNDN